MRRGDRRLQSQNDRFALCDNNGMFELGGDGFVYGLQRPAVFFLDNMSFAGGEERLDGQDQTFGQNEAFIRFIEIVYGGRLVVEFAFNGM